MTNNNTANTTPVVRVTLETTPADIISYSNTFGAPPITIVGTLGGRSYVTGDIDHSTAITGLVECPTEHGVILYTLDQKLTITTDLPYAQYYGVIA